ncbi:neuropeptides capa receptor-like isoform X2 [Bicyclus anynana]|uniref:Neuropeptides capa receptor-like isoform X2 n=1 Tax=Bicyclus anynana TaxID=110368 RepID=A0ABM3M001_BICAN|nr:neuropeptides capa receptor-like isoform X2 [Bicyclus anynana]
MEEFLRVNETSYHFYSRCTNLSAFDCSEQEMLWCMMGPRRLPLARIVPITACLLLIFATGVVGNVAVCVVIVRHPAMRTDTNYYLFSLALSDLLLLLFGLPNDLSVYWHQYPYSLGVVFCKLRALISEAASYVSVLTIVAFTLERYLAICHPLHIYAVAGLRRALRIVLALWALSLLAASPFAHYTTVNYHDYPPASGNASLESAFCAMLELPSWHICELSSFFFFILPGVVILCLYVRMGLRIRSTHTHTPGSPGTLNGVNGSVHGEARQAQSRKNIIRMLAAVVVAFFVCWAPFHFQRLFFIYGSGVRHYHTINEYLFLAAGVLYYISATVNPILYNIMSHRYRIAFKETLCCKKVRRKKSRYRDQSSIRETTINHTSDGSHSVRIRSHSHERRSRTERARRNSFCARENCARNSCARESCARDNANDTRVIYSERWREYNRRENGVWRQNNTEASQLMLRGYTRKYDCEL